MSELYIINIANMTNKNEIIKIVQQAQNYANEWVNLAVIGLRLSNAGINYKTLGYRTLKDYLDQFKDVLELYKEQRDSGPPIHYVRCLQASTIKNKSQRGESTMQSMNSMSEFENHVSRRGLKCDFSFAFHCSFALSLDIIMQSGMFMYLIYHLYKILSTFKCVITFELL